MTALTMNPILIAAAVIPAIVLLVRVYKADRLDREPTGLLISLVLFGILSTFLAMVAERVGMTVLSHFVAEDSILYNAILYFGIVAFGEEGAKYILLRKRTWNSPHFNCQFDGVVYAVFVSLGFALWENLGYVAMNGIATALVRAVTAVPGHACFGVFMGVFYGAAKRFDGMGRSMQSKHCRHMALVLPALIHGTYDFIATFSSAHAGWVFVAFVLIMFFGSYRLVKNAAADDRYIAQPYDPDPPESF